MGTGTVEGLERELSAARRNVFLLMFAQALLASSGPIVFSVGALAGYNLLGADKSLATAPLTGFNVGTHVGDDPAAVAERLPQYAVGSRHPAPRSYHAAGCRDADACAGFRPGPGCGGAGPECHSGNAVGDR